MFYYFSGIWVLSEFGNPFRLTKLSVMVDQLLHCFLSLYIKDPRVMSFMQEQESSGVIFFFPGADRASR